MIGINNKVFTESYTVSSDIYLVGEQDATLAVADGIVNGSFDFVATAAMTSGDLVFRSARSSLGTGAGGKSRRLSARSRK